MIAASGLPSRAIAGGCAAAVWVVLFASVASAVVLPDPAGRYERLCPNFNNFERCNIAELQSVFSVPNTAFLNLQTTGYFPATDTTPPASLVHGIQILPLRWDYIGPFNPATGRCLGSQVRRPATVVYEFDARIEWNVTPTSITHSPVEITMNLTSPLPEFPVITRVAYDLEIDVRNGILKLGPGRTLESENGPHWPCVNRGGIGATNPPYVLAFGPAQFQATADVVGRAVSEQGTLTEFPNAVHRGDVALYRQPGPIRDQLVDESDNDYRDFVLARIDEQGWPLVRSRAFGPLADGSFDANGPGWIELADVPAFVLEPVPGAARVWQPAWYTVVVTSAETDEFVLDDTNEPIPGERETLFFDAGVATNVLADTPAFELTVRALAGPQAKIHVAESVLGVCPVNLAMAEQQAIAHAGTFLDGNTYLTPEASEGLQRGVWAERSVAIGGQLAEQLLAKSLEGFSELFADLLDELLDASSSSLTETRRKAEAMRNRGELGSKFGLAADDFQSLDTLAAAYGQLGPEFIDTVFSRLRELVKSVQPLSEELLFRSGLSRERAESISAGFTRVVVALSNAIAKRSVAGVTKAELLRLLKAEIQQQWLPQLMDDADPDEESFCYLEKQATQYAADSMEGWALADPDTYRRDRDRAADRISKFSDEATAILQAQEYFLGIASGLSATESFLSVISNLHKAAKVGEIVSKIGKFGYNGAAWIVGHTWAFSLLQQDVDVAAYRAFGQEGPPPGAAVAARASQTALTTFVLTPPDAAPYGAALTALYDALSDDDLAAVIEQAAGIAAESFTVEGARWRAATGDFLLAASGLPGGTVADATLDLYRAARVGDLERIALEATLAGLVDELFTDAALGAFEDPQDDRYLAARERTRAAVDVLRFRVAAQATQLSQLRSFLGGSSPSLRPALAVHAVELVSSSTGDDTVMESPQSFTLRARVANLSGVAIDDISAVATVESAGSFLLSGPTEQLIGTLAAHDGAEDGADETVLTWSVDYLGALDQEVALLSVELLIAGTAPDNVALGDAAVLLWVDPLLSDRDLDSLPDGYESDHMLDPNIADALADTDSDGLNNLAESRLGTHPNDPDSDDDGLGDGEEYQAGADGLTSDPLAQDSDGDGTIDGQDGAPLDPRTISSMLVAEPAVGLSHTVAILTADKLFDAVIVDNTGTGTLVWSARSEDPGLAVVRPGEDGLGGEGQPVFVAAPDGFDFGTIDVMTTLVTVADVAGADKDQASILVVLGGDVAPFVCGHGSDASVGRMHTASDALIALSTAVGLAGCKECRCDVIGGNGVTATDALLILRKAVGQNLELSCPSC